MKLFPLKFFPSNQITNEKPPPKEGLQGPKNLWGFAKGVSLSEAGTKSMPFQHTFGSVPRDSRVFLVAVFVIQCAIRTSLSLFQI